MPGCESVPVHRSPVSLLLLLLLPCFVKTWRRPAALSLCGPCLSGMLVKQVMATALPPGTSSPPFLRFSTREKKFPFASELWEVGERVEKWSSALPSVVLDA